METHPIADAVSLSLAPIFLIVGIGALLNVMTQRLGRAVDRARVLESIVRGDNQAHPKERQELLALDSRIFAANWAIYATTVSALLVCLLVALLFIERLASFDIGAVVAGLFIATMTTLTVGLGFFMREISVANRSLRVQGDLLR